MNYLTEADNGSVVELRVGGQVVLRLPENAATGYHWMVEPVDANLIDLREGDYLPTSGAVGSGGEMQWVVRAKATGTARIRFKRRRAWEDERSVRERFEFTLRIVP